MINGRGFTKSLYAAFGGGEREGSEVTSRSARRLPPPGPLLLSDLATALLINGRGFAKSPCAAFGGGEREGSEVTSRSARRLPPPGPLLLSDLATASIAVAGHGNARGAGYTLHALHAL